MMRSACTITTGMHVLDMHVQCFNNTFTVHFHLVYQHCNCDDAFCLASEVADPSASPTTIKQLQHPSVHQEHRLSAFLYIYFGYRGDAYSHQAFCFTVLFSPSQLHNTVCAPCCDCMWLFERFSHKKIFTYVSIACLYLLHLNNARCMAAV